MKQKTTKWETLASVRDTFFLRKLLGRGSDNLLTALDYYYADGDQENFKKDYGVDFREARKILEKFIKTLY